MPCPLRLYLKPHSSYALTHILLSFYTYFIVVIIGILWNTLRAISFFFIYYFVIYIVLYI